VGTPPLEWTVGVGFCTGSPEVLQLVRFTYGFFVSSIQDALICLGPADPASLNPPVPAYLDCSSAILPFGILTDVQSSVPDGCGLLYPSFSDPICNGVVAVEQSTWGTLKSSY
jgi:hypothetical protein